MRPKFDEYILKYIVLRIDAGLASIISPIPPMVTDPLGGLGASIRLQWPSVSKILKQLANDITKRRYVNWKRAERVGLTNEMLDLKREALDQSLGRFESISEFKARVTEASKSISSRNDFFSPNRIFVQSGSGEIVSQDVFLDLSKDLLGSITKIPQIEYAIELIMEFISVVRAAMKMTGRG
jgi:hypothetical protein